MKAEMFIKSGTEMPDVETTVDITNNECEARYSDDPEDLTGSWCGGHITWSDNEGRCNNCEALYLKGYV